MCFVLVASQIYLCTRDDLLLWSGVVKPVGRRPSLDLRDNGKRHFLTSGHSVKLGFFLTIYSTVRKLFPGMSLEWFKLVTI
jgi:hypothetical protein